MLLRKVCSAIESSEIFASSSQNCMTFALNHPEIDDGDQQKFLASNAFKNPIRIETPSLIAPNEPL